MKKLFGSLFLLMILALIFGILFFLKQRTDNSAFTLYRESGEVFYKTSEASSYLSMTDNKVDLPSGSFIKTGKGLAQIVYPDNSVMSLDENTELQIHIDSAGTSIYQNAGNTWHRVESLSKGKEYKVETPTTLAAVRGTKFAVGVLSPDLSEVYVIENEVDIAQVELVDGEKKFSEFRQLVQNKLAKIHNYMSEKGIEMQDLPEEYRKRVWFLRNQLLDQQFDENPVGDFIKRIINTDNTSLQQKLENFDKFDSAIRERIDNYLDMSDGGERTCSRYRLRTAESIISELESLEDQYGVANKVAEEFGPVIRAMKSACSDGKITADESEQIRGLMPEKVEVVIP